MDTALELFSNEGFESTPTSKISNEAGVSEGLIFRHFTNKNGLLQAVMLDVEDRINNLFQPIIQCLDPQMAIKLAISLPFSIKKAEYVFWRLKYKLKWESAYDNPDNLQPLIKKLSWAFYQLGQNEPKLEAQFMVQTIEVISTEILKGNLKQKTKYKNFLLDKYEF